MRKSKTNLYFSAISAITAIVLTLNPGSLSYADEAPTLATQHVAINFQNEMWAATFSHDDSSFYFAEIGQSGLHQILTNDLMQGGQPIPANSDGMASFRTRIANWQNADLYVSKNSGPAGHHWLYGAAGNCAVITGSCQSATSQGGLWAVDTDAQNSVTSIPLLRANGEGQDGQVFGVTGTPDGKYVYALAGKGGRNTGPGGKQLFKIDAKTNSQIGKGLPVTFVLDRLYANDDYVYGLADGHYLKVKIDADVTQPNGDSEAVMVDMTGQPTPDLAFIDGTSFILQGDLLISGASPNTACSSVSGQIGIVNVVTGASKVLSVGASVLPVYPQFGGDGNIYAFDLCSSKVLEIDAESGVILSQSIAFPAVGSLSGIWPFGVMSHDRSKYVVGGGNNGGLIVVNANPPRIPRSTKAPILSGSGLQGTKLVVDSGSWSASPAARTSLQWFRCEKAVRSNVTVFAKSSKCIAIPGATKTTYKLKIEDAGLYLTVMTKATNSLGSVAVSTKSFHTPKVSAPKATRSPVISGTVAVGNTISSTTGTWSGNPKAKTSTHWYRCDNSVSAGRQSLSCTLIPGASKSRYRISPADKGKHLTVLVTANNSVGSNSSTARSTGRIG